MINMTLISGEKFTRGSLESPDEMPLMQVKLDPFFMDVKPVTNEDFQVFIEQGGYQEADLWSSEGLEFISQLGIKEPLYWNDPNWNQADQPVTGISWHEAVAYAKFVGKSLPTEAQWEFAAKGNDNRKYPWGNAEASLLLANFAPDCEPTELNRRSTPWHAHIQNRSPFGCIDMAGNLAEWCQDNYSPNYNWDQSGINPLYKSSITDDFVTRGGSGLHDSEYMRCSSRDPYPPTVRDNIVGFRCVKLLAKDSE